MNEKNIVSTKQTKQKLKSPKKLHHNKHKSATYLDDDIKKSNNI